MVDCEDLDWATKLLYTSIFVSSLMFGVLVLYLLCRSFGDEEDDLSISPRQVNRRRWSVKFDRFRKGQKDRTHIEASEDATTIGPPINPDQTAQTIFSVIGKSLHENDMIVTSATSSLPLRDLGIKHNDVVVDVNQELIMDKDRLNNLSQENQCIVCRARKLVTWSQLICYAQTTVALLVYRRSRSEKYLGTAQEKPLKSNSDPSLLSASPSMVVQPGSRREKGQANDLSNSKSPINIVHKYQQAEHHKH